MKATIAALCFLAAAVSVIALLPENICRAPHPISSCAGAVKTMWYFDDRHDGCVSYLGCGGGLNDFGSKPCCRDSCPYGLKMRHTPTSSLAFFLLEVLMYCI